MKSGIQGPVFTVEGLRLSVKDLGKRPGVGEGLREDFPIYMATQKELVR